MEIIYKPIKTITIYSVHPKTYKDFCSTHCTSENDGTVMWSCGVMFVCYYFTQTDTIMNKTLQDQELPIQEISYCVCKNYEEIISHPKWNTKIEVRNVKDDPVYGIIGEWLNESTSDR
jgi:hypothetical protein